MNTCQYWNCKRKIKDGHFLCTEHYEAYEDGDIDKCPKCGRYKDADYDLCLDCKKNKSIPKSRNRETMKENKSYKLEYSKKWEKKDKDSDKFFVYILKNPSGKFYVGHTRDLRARMSEHRDGKTRTTASGRHELQYFEECNSRILVAKREVELKKLVDRDERKIRKMIIEFQDRVKELKLE